MRSTSNRNQGAVLLARKGLSQEEIATRIGVSQTVVCFWLSGSRIPKTVHRAALRRAYAIPLAAWDSVPEPAAPTKKKAPAAEPRGWEGQRKGYGLSGATLVPGDASPTAIDEDDVSIADLARVYRRSLVMVSEQLEQGRTQMTYEEILDAVEKATRIINSLSKLTGEGQEVNEAKIMRLPQFTRIASALIRTLAPWPDALRAVNEALARLKDSHA